MKINDTNTRRTAQATIGFIPPSADYALVRVCQTLWPAYSKLCQSKLSVHMHSSLRDILRQIRSERVILCPNHSAHDDALVAFGISAEAGQQFYFLTAREIFMWHPSVRSLWLQQLGCYSLLRGSTDVEAYKETCSLLVNGPNKLIVFPEGEVTHQNRFVMSLENGAERMALTAAESLTDAGSLEPVFILPVGIAYRYPQDITSSLLDVLSIQQRKLGLPVELNLTVEQRIRRVFDEMLHVLEIEHQCAVEGKASLGTRISNFIETTIKELATACAVDNPVNGTQRERLHVLKKEFTNHRYSHKRKSIPEYERTLYKQLKRAINFIGLTDSSFANINSQEALAELICILEYGTSGRITLNCHKEAYVGCSTPIYVNELHDLYQKDRKAAVLVLSEKVHSGIEQALAMLNAAYPYHRLERSEEES